MPLLRIIFYGFLFFFLIRIIIRYVLPIISTTRIVRQKMNEMRHGMNEQMPPQQQAKEEAKPKKPARGEYIDYEEVKD